MRTHFQERRLKTDSKEAFWPIMTAIFFGAFIAVLNTSTINIAIPSLMEDFHSPVHTMQWTLTGFMLATGLSAPLSGYIGDRFGTRNSYVFVLLGLAMSSVLCALAWNPLSLILFRVVQGFFCGVIMPITMTIIYQTFDQEKHAFAISLWSVASWIGPAFGPTMAGVILHYASWQWIFIVNIPLALFSVVLVLRYIPKTLTRLKPTFDLSGLILVLYCSFALLVVCSEAMTWGFMSRETLLFTITGVFTLVLFIRRELRTKDPLLNLRVFKKSRFTVSVIINAITTMSLFAGVYLIPLFMQTVQGASPLKTGLVLLPASLVMVIVMPLVGKMYNRVGPFILTLIGLIIIAWSQWQLHSLTVDISSSYLLLWMLVRNVGLAFASAPVTNAGMEVISRKLYGHASAVNNWTRQVVSSFAIGLFTTLYAARQVVHLSRLDGKGSSTSNQIVAMTEGMNDVFFISTIIVIMAIPLSFWLRNKRLPVKENK